MLQRGRRGKGKEPVSCPDPSRQVGRSHCPTDLPPGQREGLAQGGQGHRSLPHPGQLGKGQMLAIEDHVLVYLVGDGDQVVTSAQVGDRFHLEFGKHPPGRIVGCIDHYGPRSVVDRRLEIVDRKLELRGAQGHIAGYGSGQSESYRVGVIRWLDQDDSVPGFEEADEGCGEGLRAARGHRHVTARLGTP